VRWAGRIKTSPDALELFARSLGPRDRVALEVTGGAWEIARILEGRVAAARSVWAVHGGVAAGGCGEPAAAHRLSQALRAEGLVMRASGRPPRARVW
jgi:hypothetical protein